MNVSLSASNTPFLRGYVCLKSRMPLEELAVQIAQRVVPGQRFGGKHEYISDEVPAVYVSGPLGCRLILQGTVEEGYDLVLEHQRYPYDEVSVDDPMFSKVNVSGLLAYLIRDVEGIEIVEL